MSDDIKNRDLDSTPSQDQDTKDTSIKQSRRQFTKAGVGGGAVLLTLYSRPSLGTGGYSGGGECAHSVMASYAMGNNMSADMSVIDDCRRPKDCSKRFWKKCYDDNYVLKCWEDCAHNSYGQCHPDMSFNQYFGVHCWNNDKTFLQCLRIREYRHSDSYFTKS